MDANGWLVASRSSTTERAVFTAILAAFAVLSLTYNVVTPAGEGVDEIPHLRYVLYIKDHHALPVLSSVPRADTVLMGHHAPLYYVLAALLIAPFRTDDLDQALPPNPHFYWIEGYGPGNRNVFLHSPLTGEDPFPYHGVILAIHLLRLFSTVEGIVALLAARALCRSLVGDHPPLLIAAMAATAFQPTFVSTFSVANNDGAVAVLTLLGLLWSVTSVERAFRCTGPSSPVLGGGALGLALLAKADAFALGPVYAVATTLIALKTRRWKETALWAASAAGVTLALSGWWFARNFVLYGDPLAQNVFASTHPSLLREGAYGWGDVVAFFQQLRRTYWGSFGYMHVLVDQRVGDAFWIMVGIAFPGFLLFLVSRRGKPDYLAVWAVAVTAVGSLIALFIRYSLLVGGVGHGRFFVAVMPVVAAAVVLGLAQLTPRRWPVGPIIFAGSMVAYGFAAPFAVIEPAYRPPIATPGEISAAKPRRVSFGGDLELVAMRTEPESVGPGQVVSATFFWRLTRPIRSDLRFRLRTVARDGTVFFDHEYWPAGGGVPTYTWPEGVIYRDTIMIPVPPNVAPGFAHVRVGVQSADGEWLDASGGRDVDVGRLAVAGVPVVTQLPTGSTSVAATFADTIDLLGYQIAGRLQAGQTLEVRLFWRASRPIEEDATVSVQLLDATGKLVAQNDSEPSHGRAPTSTWPVGEIVVDEHDVVPPKTLPSGAYQVIVVLYTRPTLTRLRVVRDHLWNDHLPLTILTAR